MMYRVLAILFLPLCFTLIVYLTSISGTNNVLDINDKVMTAQFQYTENLDKEKCNYYFNIFKNPIALKCDIRDTLKIPNNSQVSIKYIEFTLTRGLIKCFHALEYNGEAYYPEVQSFPVINTIFNKYKCNQIE